MPLIVCALVQVTTNYIFDSSVPRSWSHLKSEELSLSDFWDIHIFIFSSYIVKIFKKIPIRKSLPAHHLLTSMSYLKWFWWIGYILWSILCELHCEIHSQCSRTDSVENDNQQGSPHKATSEFTLVIQRCLLRDDRV